MTTNEGTIQPDPLSSLGGAFESATKSIGDATADARESAKVAAQKVKETAR